MYLKDTTDSLTRIGPRTPMGDVLRRFWVPALLEREMPKPGDEPVEVRLFGEDLVAECDAPGHLFLTDRYFKEMAPYPAIVSGGIVWTYMGPHEFKPQLPVFPWSALPPLKRALSNHIEQCNWTYALEASLTADSHPIFLPPFYTSATPDHGHAHVPIDDTTTCIWSFGTSGHPETHEALAPLNDEAIAQFHHTMITYARDTARGHTPDAASNGDWYSQRPFPL